MQIETSTYHPKFNSKKALNTAGIAALSLLTVTPIALIILGRSSTPTGTYISPLPKDEVTQNSPSSDPIAPTPIITYASAVNLSQNYLNKAFELSKNPNQSEADRKQIIDTLNHSLNQANTAISLSPKDAQGYVLRARILTAISKLNPDAIKQAQNDLEIAQNLSNGKEINLPAPINPINLIPDQQASLAQNIIIAGPEASNSAEQQVDTSGNATTTTITLPATQTEMLINDPNASKDSYIYLIPKSSTNITIYVKSKTDGQFTIATTAVPATDLLIDYWIINP